MINRKTLLQKYVYVPPIPEQDYGTSIFPYSQDPSYSRRRRSQTRARVRNSGTTVKM